MRSQRKFLEAILIGLTNRANIRRPLPCAKVTADLASPDGHRPLRSGSCLLGIDFTFSLILLQLFALRPPLRNLAFYLLLAFQDLLGNVKSSVALLIVV